MSPGITAAVWYVNALWLGQLVPEHGIFIEEVLSGSRSWDSLLQLELAPMGFFKL